DFWKLDLNSSSWTRLNDIPNYTGNTRPQTIINSKGVFSFFDRKLFEYNMTLDEWSQLRLELPYQYQRIIGIYSDNNVNIDIPVIEINNALVGNSTLHYLLYDSDSEEYQITQTFSPFGSTVSFLRRNDGITYFVRANRELYFLNGGSQTEIELPNNGIIYYAEAVNGNLYTGFNDGTFWRFDPTK
ncbi:MAG: hypothetical protein AAF391_12765, partial [Bacteroidota bacterium]